MPTLSIIAAVAANGVIGRNGALPWRLSADLRRFKRLTMGRPILMGRRTWESIGRPLPGRTSVVVTRSTRYETPYPAVRIVHDFAAALDAAAAAPGGELEAFVVGGAGLYAAALPRADRLHLTRVLDEVDGDARFPPYDAKQWRLLDAEPRAADADNDYAIRFETYERVSR